MHKFEVIGIISQPNSNITIQFKDINGTFPTYQAGQFLTLCFKFGDREVRRSYSFSSSPAVDEPIAITVKRVDNGEISRLLHHKLQVGDSIDVLDPQGLFYYSPTVDSQQRVFLFAAGVGITPLFSILKTALVKETNSKIVLVYSNSSKEQTIFYDELLQWQEQCSERLTIYWLFSNSKNLLNARLNRDYLIQIVNKHSESIDNSIFYTCGPIFYMDLCRFTLLGMGIPSERILKETFHFPEEEEDEDEHDEEEVDTRSYRVKLIFQGNSYDLSVPYNQTVLDIGLDHKIKLPYSCKSGMCSTCISQVTVGSVRMDYNEILTDKEVELGKCLICTAHPLQDGTTIEVY